MKIIFESQEEKEVFQQRLFAAQTELAKGEQNSTEIAVLVQDLYYLSQDKAKG